MFHGNDERVDQESLALSTQLWEAVARDLVGLTATRQARRGSRASDAGRRARTPGPAHTRNSIATQQRRTDAEVEGAAVDATGGGDRDHQVARRARAPPAG